MPEGTVLITDHQTRGRGQRGNTWESGKGENLTFSILLRPRFLAVRDQFRLSMTVALGIAEGLAEVVSGRIMLKWPNDILMEGKKVGGILIENQSHGAQLSVAIVGIGINVNAHKLPHPGAGALIQAVGHESGLNDVFQLLAGAIEARYLQLRSGGHAVIERDYLGQLYRLGVPQDFEADGAVFMGTIMGIDDLGRIRIRVGEEERRYSLKEVKFRL